MGGIILSMMLKWVHVPLSALTPSSLWEQKFPLAQLVLGSPAKIRRALSLDEQNDIARWAWSYVETAKYFREFYASQKL